MSRVVQKAAARLMHAAGARARRARGRAQQNDERGERMLAEAHRTFADLQESSAAAAEEQLERDRAMEGDRLSGQEKLGLEPAPPA